MSRSFPSAEKHPRLGRGQSTSQCPRVPPGSALLPAGALRFGGNVMTLYQKELFFFFLAKFGKQLLTCHLLTVTV